VWLVALLLLAAVLWIAGGAVLKPRALEAHKGAADRHGRLAPVVSSSGPVRAFSRHYRALEESGPFASMYYVVGTAYWARQLPEDAPERPPTNGQ
jgi:hypothetical protein